MMKNWPTRARCVQRRLGKRARNPKDREPYGRRVNGDGEKSAESKAALRRAFQTSKSILHNLNTSVM